MNIYQYDNINLIKIFKSLSDENRLRIVRALIHGYFNVNEIFYIVGGKQSNISHHLKILLDANLLKSKKDGSWIYYGINNQSEHKPVENILNFIKSEEKNIPYYEDDTKRMEGIINKRKKNAEDFFNKIGKDLDSLQEELFKELYSVSNVIKLFENKLDEIIDIGCGTGKHLPFLAKYAEKVIGIDSSPSMLQLTDHLCKINNLNYELKLGDAQKIPYTSESIQGAFINMVLHHISEPINVVKETARILKVNGTLLLIELLAHNDEIMRDKYADLWLGFDESEIEEWLKKTNFSIKNNIIKKNDNYSVIIIKAVKNSMSSR
ncbi:MAG: ArsR family transcriptional regulator [Spirochaetes bacterium]|nr:ArsR family transcriptional regulator [Spirochaetota bacterium]